MDLPLTQEEAATGHSLPQQIRNASAALVVAHPGHELRIHGWLELACPVVFILTDGSGHSEHSRLESTTRVLRQANAKPGSIYGRFRDLEIYTAILNRDFNVFIGLTQELAEALLREEIDYVVGDAIEGYNPTHDLCRIVINAAIELTRTSGTSIANFDFSVVGESACCESGEETIQLRLDEKALQRKQASTDGYPELRDEVNSILNQFGSEALQNERLRQVNAHNHRYLFLEASPFYESYGEKQVAAGIYSRVIRYREHVLPLAEAIWDHVQR